MAHTTSARKRVRQAAKRRARNKAQRSTLRTQLKKTLAAIKAGNSEAAKAELAKAVRALDRAAGKSLIHKNQAARRKSRLAHGVNAIAKPAT